VIKDKFAALLNKLRLFVLRCAAPKCLINSLLCLKACLHCDASLKFEPECRMCRYCTVGPAVYILNLSVKRPKPLPRKEPWIDLLSYMCVSTPLFRLYRASSCTNHHGKHDIFLI